jgi:glycerate 2-kinase
VERQALLSAFLAGVKACDPAALVREHLSERSGTIVIGLGDGGIGFDVRPSDVVVIGIGKAAVGMAEAACSVTGSTRGVVIPDRTLPSSLPVILGDHPIPGEASFEAGAELVRFLSTVRTDDLVIFCVSGGGSALVEVPVPGVTRADISALNAALVTSGLAIEDMNEVRAAASAVKAGGLLDFTPARRVVTLVLSDLPNGPASAVASGPTIPSDLGSRAGRILARSRIEAPDSVRRAVERRRPGTVVEREEIVVVVGSPRTAAAAAAAELEAGGADVDLVEEPLAGSVPEVLERFIARMGNGRVVVAAGEPTLAVRGSGVGGRNQHAALLAAGWLEGTVGTFGAFATDGRDGPTTAAGAIVDGATIARMSADGVDPDRAVASFDSHRALKASGDLVETGRTGTNVADLWIGSVSRSTRGTP